MRLDIVLDCGYLNIMIWHMCCLFLVLKALQAVLVVLLFVFTHLVIIFTLLMIIYQKSHCVNTV